MEAPSPVCPQRFRFSEVLLLSVSMCLTGVEAVPALLPVILTVVVEEATAAQQQRCHLSA